MSKLEELIDSLCPNGVDFQAVGIACDTITDYTAAGSFADIAKNVRYLSSGGYAQLVRTTDLKSKFTSKNPVYVDEHAFNYLWRVNLDRPSLILPNIGNCGEVYYCLPEELPNKHNVLGPNAILIRSSSVDLKFLYHLFQESQFQKKLRTITSTVGQGKFNKTSLKNLRIPVPPLEVQREIVRILDNFTELTAELTAELTTRKKQYENYLNCLLTFGDTVPKYRVGDLFDFKNGLNKGKEFFGRGNYIVKYTDVYKNRRITQALLSDRVECNEKELRSLGVHRGDVFFTRTSETREEVGIASVMLDEVENCVFSGFLLRARPKTNLLLPEYCAYCFATKEVRSFISSATPFTTRASLSGTILSQMSISVPSIERQWEIVKFLDSFESLVNGLSGSLPAEIEARQKQYEFYRNKLLAFEGGNNE